jgi:hypothetical protein
MSGYFTAPQLSTVKTGGQIDLYVAGDAVGSSDSNPGTIASPLKTINEAIRRCNLYDEITAAFNIHVAAAPIAGYVLTTTVQAHLLRGNITIIGDGAGQGTDGFTVLRATAAAQAGSTIAQIVTPAGLGVNTFRGKTVEVITGAAIGDRRTIRDNTDTVITPVRNFSAAVAANDTFRIIEPAATVTYSAGASTPYVAAQDCGAASSTPLPMPAQAATPVVGLFGVYHVNF